MSEGPEDTRTPDHKKRRERYDLIDWRKDMRMEVPKSVRVAVRWSPEGNVIETLTIKDN